MKIGLSLLITVLVLTAGVCQEKKLVNNKKCAVVLTYDDALNVHLDNAIPLLDSLQLKGTFYLSAYAPACKNRINDWRKAAEHGHELANHTLFHPCRGGAGREWVVPERDLDKYSMQRTLEEIRMTNVFLEAIDGKKKRTFAYPCGDMTVDGVSYVNEIKDDFVAARGVESKMLNIQQFDLFNTGAFGINGQSGEEMIALVEKAKASNSVIVFLFHGVGGEHGLNVALREHKKLLQYLKKNEKEIWTAPFLEVMEYAKKR
jgi:peptidoglycan-N-acetylglucosamine deacetylase